MKISPLNKGFPFKKAIIPRALVFLLSCFPLFAQESSPATKSFQLDNGLQVFLYVKKTLPLVNCVFGVNVGSKDETEETNGLVHILEHYILFRGVKNDSGLPIGRDLRSRGAYFNAHTGRDVSLYEITVPSEFIDFAFETHKKILFDLKFDQKALNEEKAVILEEIGQVKGDIFKYLSSLVYQNLFQGHPYEKPIYGEKEVIESATVDQLEAFHKKYFVASNCSLVVVGDFSMEETEAKIRKIFGKLPNEDIPPQNFKKIAPLKKTIEMQETRDVSMGYMAIGMTGPDYNDSQQFAADILLEIFGRGLNPLLNRPLVQRRIFVNSLRMGYQAHKYGGAIYIYVAMEPQRLKTARQQLIQFLRQARRFDYSKKDAFGDAQFYATDHLRNAKNHIKFRTEFTRQKGLVVASSIARFILINETPNRGNYLENIEKVTSSDLRKAAGDHLGQKDYVIVSIVPQKK